MAKIVRLSQRETAHIGQIDSIAAPEFTIHNGLPTMSNSFMNIPKQKVQITLTFNVSMHSVPTFINNLFI